MRPHLFSAIAVAGLAPLLGCGSDVVVGAAQLHVRGSEVAIAPAGRPEAVVREDGSLFVGGTAVALSEATRAQLVGYNTAARARVQHGLATGRAGAAVAASAASEVAKGLAGGDISQIGAKVEAKADDVRQAAVKICDDLAAMRVAQEAAAASVEAFRPYAVVADSEVKDCHR